MKTNLFDLKFWAWVHSFKKALLVKLYYREWFEVQDVNALRLKWSKVCFFEESSLFYHPYDDFSLRVLSFLEEDAFSNYNFNHKTEELLMVFRETPEQTLFNFLIFSLYYWRFTLFVLKDLYKAYIKNGSKLSFDEREFVHIDYWLQLPSVIEDLLNEFNDRDFIFRDIIYEVHHRVYLDFSFEVRPPVTKEALSSEKAYSHLSKYALREDPDKDLLKIINLYLNARPAILAECTKDLLAKGIQITEESLAEYFLGEFTVKKVSKSTLYFLVGNADLNSKDPLTRSREEIRRNTDNFFALYPEKFQEELIDSQKRLSEAKDKEMADLKLTLEERKENYKKSSAEKALREAKAEKTHLIWEKLFEEAKKKKSEETGEILEREKCHFVFEDGAWRMITDDDYDD